MLLDGENSVFDGFDRPIHNVLRSTSLTWRASARHMIRQRSGGILAFGGDGAFAASAWARSVTGSAINFSCGAILD